MTNAKKAKALRREVREELSFGGAEDRELVIGKVNGDVKMTTARNTPFSHRGLYRELKKKVKTPPHR